MLDYVEILLLYSLMLVRLWFEVGVYLYIVMNDYKGSSVGGFSISV